MSSTPLPPKPNPSRGLGKVWGKTPQSARTNTKKAHLISLSASPTLGCGINTGKYLFITTQHTNICFSLSHGHTHIDAACQTPSFPKNLGSLLSAEAGQEGYPACKVFINMLGYLAIWCPHAEECFFLDIWTSTQMLFWITHPSTHLSSCMHKFLHLYVCMCAYAYTYIHISTHIHPGMNPVLEVIVWMHWH